MRHLGREELWFAAESHAALLRGLDAGACALGDERALELGQDADHLPHGAARGGVRVDRLGKRAELHAALLELVEHVDEIREAPAEPVELPDDQRIAGLQGLEAPEQGRALRRGSRDSLVFEHGFTAGLLQGCELQGGVLVLGRDASVAVFHARQYETDL